MSIPIVQVDAFTADPFAGNPAAVCVLPGERDAAWMQLVAREMNLSETAFLVARDDGFDLRWFTPAAEVDLCGHATLASAHVLWETGLLPRTQQARFHSKSGLLTADSRGDWIELNFPATPCAPADPPPGLLEALNVKPLYAARNRIYCLLELSNEEEVRSVRPDFGRLREVDARGIIVTSLSASPGFDFVSRFFAPALGVDEDPVTGSAHCCLTPFWSDRLKRTAFTARQVSARGGVLRLQLDGDRVRLGGQAVTILRGELAA
jgi:predicted PhzF superfamily epimerase YddE/YHI9